MGIYLAGSPREAEASTRHGRRPPQKVVVRIVQNDNNALAQSISALSSQVQSLSEKVDASLVTDTIRDETLSNVQETAERILARTSK
jgi:hypothetical protein